MVEGGKPILLLLLLFLLLLPIVPRLPSSPGGSPGRRLFPLWATFLLLLWLLVTAPLYVSTPSFKDPVEPFIAVGSRLVIEGRPLYQGFEDPELTSLPYGPCTFLLGSWLHLSGMGLVQGSKLAGLLQGFSGLVILLASFVKAFGWERALRGFGLVLAVLLLFTHFSYWNRSDSLLLLASSLGCTSVLAGGAASAGILAGLAGGLALGAKLHGFLYLLPLVPLLVLRKGWRPLIPAALLSFLLFLLPFLLLPSFSGAGFVGWLLLSSAHPFDSQAAFPAFSYAAVASLPLALWGIRGGTRSPALRLSLGLFLPCLLLVIVIASKKGAGHHHFLPFAPVLGLLLLRAEASPGPPPPVRPWISTLKLAWILVLLLGVGKSQKNLVRFLLRDQSGSAREELAGILEQHSGERMAIGVGGSKTYPLSFLRPMVVERTGEDFLSPVTVWDLRQAGRRVPESSLDRLRSGYFDLYILPAGEAPFSLKLAEDPDGLLFGPEVGRAFLKGYAHLGTGRHYALWGPKRRR